MLKPAFALVSMNMTFKSRALASPSSTDTCLCNDGIDGNKQQTPETEFKLKIKQQGT